MRRGVCRPRRGGEHDAALHLRVSGPSFAEKAVQHIGFFAFVTMIGALGATAMAANQTMVSLESICFLSADGFGIAAASIVAQRLGARRPEEAAYAARVATGLAIGSLGTVGLFRDRPDLLLRHERRVDRGRGRPRDGDRGRHVPFMAAGVVLTGGARRRRHAPRSA